MLFFRRLLRSLRTRPRREAITGWFLEMSVLICGVPASLEFIREGDFDVAAFGCYIFVGLIFAGIGSYFTTEEK